MKSPAEKDIISIIIPVYNVEDYLKDCLDSVLEQTYDNLEIIVVDDGSTDSSGRICDEYAEIHPNIHVFHQDNMGLSGARNTALDKVSGEWIVFVDSDDYIHPDMVSSLYSAAVKEKLPFAKCGYMMTRSSKTDQCWEETVPFEKAVSKRISSCEEMKQIILDNVWSVVWGAIYRKSMLEGMRFLTGSNYEDILFTAQLLAKQPELVRVDNIYCAYRLRGDSITHARISGKKLDFIRMTYRRDELVSTKFPSLNNLATERFWGRTVNLYNEAKKYKADDVAKELLDEVHKDYLVNHYSTAPLHDKTIPFLRRAVLAGCKRSFKLTCFAKRTIRYFHKIPKKDIR